jgi:hypothetical protein
MADAAYSLEVTGAGLVLLGPGGVLAAEPAWAAFEGETVVTGAAARGRARLVPLFASNRHLEEPATEPLPRQKPAVRSNADLAYAQLRSLAPLLGAEPVVLAVSSAYGLPQLSLLAGIAAAAGVAVAGVVDAAVAASADVASTPRALYLDLEMHRAVLTELHRAGELRRGRVGTARGLGLRAVEDRAAEFVGRAFVRATRFDPLHQAASEQLLYDRLPDWLAAAAGGEAEVAIEHAGLRHETRIRRAELAAALEPLAADVARLVNSARRAGERLTLYATARVAAVPGLVATLAAIENCVLVELPAGAAAGGARAHAEEVGGAALEFVTALAGSPPLTTDAAAPAPVVGRAPTHLVYQGRAYALGGEPLLVGRRPQGERTVALQDPLPGVSRTHCRLTASGADVVLEDLSTYGTFVNGGRVERRARLAAGDRIRIGTPGVELELVRLEE